MGRPGRGPRRGCHRGGRSGRGARRPCPRRAHRARRSGRSRWCRRVRRARGVRRAGRPGAGPRAAHGWVRGARRWHAWGARACASSSRRR
ncbi:hypothetical protein CYQ11_16945 [Streptomyces cinnamoneus]|nr:hypothetical protein CYQ11_16945 [Streptomyces cinnamoneus]